MIGKAGTGSGFKGLIGYLFRGAKDGSNRVEWTESLNLPTNHPRLVTKIMRAVANDNERIRKPVYHLSISFDENDNLTKAEMLNVAKTTLRDIGLEEHQALIVAHNDTDHKHIHIVVNRVHLDTGRAWSNSLDYKRIEHSLRRQERELGLREVPGVHYQLEGQEKAERDLKTSGEIRLQKETGEKSFSEVVRETVRDDIVKAGSWQEIHNSLDKHNLSLERKGQGFVITDGNHQVKASRIDRSASLKRLEERLGKYEDKQEKQLAANENQKPTYQQLKQELKDTRREIESLRTEIYNKDRVINTSREMREKFNHQFKGLFRDGDKSLEKFNRSVEATGIERATDELANSPREFGDLKGWKFFWYESQERKEANNQAKLLSPYAKNTYQVEQQAEEYKRDLPEQKDRLDRLDQREKELDRDIAKSQEYEMEKGMEMKERMSEREIGRE